VPKDERFSFIVGYPDSTLPMDGMTFLAPCAAHAYGKANLTDAEKKVMVVRRIAMRPADDPDWVEEKYRRFDK
jgi:hypothetical protein